MVEIVFHQALLFKRIIDSLKGLVEDATFDCETKGITLQAMDNCRVALIAIDLPADSFAKYDCTEPLSLSFNVDVLAKLLKNAGATDELAIRTSGANADIKMRLTSPGQDRLTTFHIRAVDVESALVSVPEHHYRARLALPSSELNQLVRTQSDINDSVTVRCEEGSISFAVSDNDKKVEGVTTFRSGQDDEDDQENIDITVTEACRMTYALRYLKAISTASSLAPRVSISFSPHFPMLVEYELTGGGFVHFYLSPKVEDEESSEEL
jgi:proliferating cell nuclear antigen